MKLSSLLVAIISASSIMVVEGRDGGGTRNLAKEKPSKPKQKKKKKDKKKKDKKKKDKKKKDKKKKDKKKKDKKDDYEKSEDYLACVEDCTLYKERCEKQCKSLEDCTSTIKNKVKKHESEWSDILDESVDEWVSKLKHFIRNAKYGMMFFDQKDFCTGLKEWITDFEGLLGLCVLYKNYPSLKKSSAPSYDSVCGNIDGGVSNTGRKLQDDDITCSITTDPMQSPTTCFEPDPSAYYNLKSTFEDDAQGNASPEDYGFLSQNYEYIEYESSKNYQKFTGQLSNQLFRYGSFCSNTQANYFNDGSGAGYTSGPEFLIGGNILQSTNTPLVTNAMWRFDEADPDAGEGFYKISNRRTGSFITYDQDATVDQFAYEFCQNLEFTVGLATADTTTNGCSFCQWNTQSASNGYYLTCLDDDSNSQTFENFYSGNLGLDTEKNISRWSTGYCTTNMWSWMNYNISASTTDGCNDLYDGFPLENSFCIEEVTNYQRADVYVPGAVTYTPAASSGSTTAKYIKGGLGIGASLMGLEIPAGVSALVKITGAVTGLGSSDDSQVEAINNLVNDIMETVDTMTTQSIAQNTVTLQSQNLNSYRSQFMCNYVTNLIQMMTGPTENGICTNLLTQDLSSSIFTPAHTSFTTLAPTNPSSYCPNNPCPDQTTIETVRTGWDLIQVSIVDMTHYLQEMMFIYAYVYATYGTACSYPVSQCSDIWENVIVGNQYQTQFTTVTSHIPKMLNFLRMSSTTLVGNANGEDLAPGDTGPDSQTSNINCSPSTDYYSSDVQCVYTGGGYNYQQYQWNDDFFSPTQQQAYWYYSTGYGGNPADININYQDILQMYYNEISWDMEHWSYNTTVDVNGTTTMLNDLFGDQYEQMMIGICEEILKDPQQAMDNHIAQLTNVTDRCNNADEVTDA